MFFSAVQKRMAPAPVLRKGCSSSEILGTMEKPLKEKNTKRNPPKNSKRYMSHTAKALPKKLQEDDCVEIPETLVAKDILPLEDGTFAVANPCGMVSVFDPINKQIGGFDTPGMHPEMLCRSPGENIGVCGKRNEPIRIYTQKGVLLKELLLDNLRGDITYFSMNRSGDFILTQLGQRVSVCDQKGDIKAEFLAPSDVDNCGDMPLVLPLCAISGYSQDEVVIADKMEGTYLTDIIRVFNIEGELLNQTKMLTQKKFLGKHLSDISTMDIDHENGYMLYASKCCYHVACTVDHTKAVTWWTGPSSIPLSVRCMPDGRVAVLTQRLNTPQTKHIHILKYIY